MTIEVALDLDIVIPSKLFLNLLALLVSHHLHMFAPRFVHWATIPPACRWASSGPHILHKMVLICLSCKDPGKWGNGDHLGSWTVLTTSTPLPTLRQSRTGVGEFRATLRLTMI